MGRNRSRQASSPTKKVNRKSRSRQRGHSMATDVASYVQKHPGIRIGELARLCDLPYEEVYALLRSLERQHRVRIDVLARVFTRKTPAQIAATARHTASDRRGRGDQVHTRVRIEENRLAWIAAVKRSWLALASPRPWVLDFDFFVRAIESNIKPAATDYLASSQIADEIKLKARQVLNVAATVRSGLRGKDIDILAFSPFKWPNTELAMLKEELGGRPLRISGALLNYVGYRVGRNGTSYAERRKALERILSDSNLPEIGEWPPYSCIRLRRVAYAIAFLVLRAKGRSADMESAISDWEADLAWLKKTYYTGRCDEHHIWPRTHLD